MPTDATANGILVHFYRHNLWANRQVLDICAGLGDEHVDAGAPGSFGSVRDTLVHLLAAEGRYVALLTGRMPENPLRESDGFPGFEALRTRAHESGETLIAIAAEARGDQQVQQTYRGESYTMSVAIPLLQAINHATEHRTNVTSILAGRGIELPEIDSWSFEMPAPGS